MKKIKASKKNYFKLLNKGYIPLFKSHIISHSVKYFILTKDKYFLNSI